MDFTLEISMYYDCKSFSLTYTHRMHTHTNYQLFFSGLSEHFLAFTSGGYGFIWNNYLHGCRALLMQLWIGII